MRSAADRMAAAREAQKARQRHPLLGTLRWRTHEQMPDQRLAHRRRSQRDCCADRTTRGCPRRCNPGAANSQLLQH